MKNTKLEEMKSKHPNHYERYTYEQLTELERVASTIVTRQDLEREAKRIAQEWGRTWGAIANKLETMTGRRKAE